MSSVLPTDLTLYNGTGLKQIAIIENLIPLQIPASGIPYIKGMNLKNVEIQSDNIDRIVNTDKLYERFYTKKGDIIISRMGTVADCGVVDEIQENWIFDSFTIRLRLKNFSLYNPYCIGICIQNIAKKYYFNLYIPQASVRQNTDWPTVKNLFIPNLKFLKIVEKDNSGYSTPKLYEFLEVFRDLLCQENEFILNYLQICIEKSKSDCNILKDMLMDFQDGDIIEFRNKKSVQRTKSKNISQF